MQKKPIRPVIITGANASGKTGIALELARRLFGEIVSADSKQVYKKLKAGTAKPEGKWEKNCRSQDLYLVDGIPYSLVDIVSPDSVYDAGRFVKDASRAFADIISRGHIPVMAGGTGMYIQAFFNGMDILPEADAGLRSELDSIVSEGGKEALHEKLMELDPETAGKIPAGNVQRVMRAVEICLLCGKPASAVWTKKFFNTLPEEKGLFVFIKWEKEQLRRRIEERTELNFPDWKKETEELLDEGYPEDCRALKILGYPQVIAHIKGTITEREAKDEIVRLSMAYAKRQNTWFSRYKNIMRIELGKEEDYDPAKLAGLIISKL